MIVNINHHLDYAFLWQIYTKIDVSVYEGRGRFLKKDYLEFFCVRLKQLRKKKGVSQRQMSLHICQSEGYITKLERRDSLPSLPVLICICKYFNMTLEEFFDDKYVYTPTKQSIINIVKEMDDQKAEHLLPVVIDITT